VGTERILLSVKLTVARVRYPCDWCLSTGGVAYEGFCPCCKFQRYAKNIVDLTTDKMLDVL
jgi:hypothetical protein